MTLLKQHNLFTLVTLIGSLAFSLLLGELFLRVFLPQKLYLFEKGLFTNSEKYTYSLTPRAVGTHASPEYFYTIKANSYGFRGREPNFRAKYRVLVLGDSFGMGQGVAEGKNLCDVSQSYFAEKGLDVDIFNTSLAGYAGINQLQVLQEQVPHYRPHLVVLLFYWNDIGVTKSIRIQNGYFVLNVENKFKAAVREWLNNHSHLYCLVKRFYYGYLAQGTTSRGRWGGFEDANLNRAANYIRRMQEICDASETEFVVAAIPLHGVYEGTVEFQKSKNRFFEILRRAQIDVEDWTAKLPKMNRERLIFKVDHHWNEAGHAYFGKILTELVIRKLEPDSREKRTTAAAQKVPGTAWMTEN